jgi:hypothetical protein
MAFWPPSVTHGAPSGPMMTPWGAAPGPSGISSFLPVLGSNRPRKPLLIGMCYRRRPKIAFHLAGVLADVEQIILAILRTKRTKTVSCCTMSSIEVRAPGMPAHQGGITGFQKGHPRYGGRRKGSKNRFGGDLREEIVAAIQETGFIQKNAKGKLVGTGKDGCKGFIKT